MSLSLAIPMASTVTNRRQLAPTVGQAEASTGDLIRTGPSSSSKVFSSPSSLRQHFGSGPSGLDARRLRCASGFRVARFGRRVRFLRPGKFFTPSASGSVVRSDFVSEQKKIELKNQFRAKKSEQKKVFSERKYCCPTRKNPYPSYFSSPPSYPAPCSSSSPNCSSLSPSCASPRTSSPTAALHVRALASPPTCAIPRRVVRLPPPSWPASSSACRRARPTALPGHGSGCPAAAIWSAWPLSRLRAEDSGKIKQIQNEEWPDASQNLPVHHPIY